MRRALRIGAWTLGSMLAVLVALVAAALIAGNTAGGRALIEHSVARLTDGHVRLAGLAGSFPTAIDLDRLQLGDERGVWLVAERASLRWSPLALLARHVKIARLNVGRLQIERRPVSHESAEGTTHMPRIDIGELAIGNLELGPQLAGVRTTLSVEGTAHLISLAEASATLAAHRTNGAGDYRLSLRSDSSRIDASLALEEPAGGALANLLQLPGLGALSVAASLEGPRTAEHLHLTASAGELRALAEGRLDLTRADADLSFRAESTAMTPAPGLSWQGIALQGEWHGAATAPRAGARLRIDRLQLRDGGELGRLDANLQAEGGSLAVQAVADGLVIPGPQPRLLADSPLRVSATVRLDDAEHPVRLTADHRLLALQAEAVAGGKPHGTFTLRLPDIGALAQVTGEKVRGSAELNGTIAKSGTTTHLDLDGNIDLLGEGESLTSLLPGRSQFQLAAALSEESLDVERLTLNGRVLSVSASGSARRGRSGSAQALESLRARFDANLASLAALSPTLAGTLKAHGRIEGPITSLAGDLQLTTSLSVRNSPRGTIEASIRARGLPSRASAALNVQGDLAGAPLRLDAALDRGANGTFHLAVRGADWKSARIEGDLTTAANMTPGHGMLRLRMEHLEDLQPLLGTPLKGSIGGDLTLRVAGASRTFTHLQLDARNLVIAEIPASAQLTASGLLDALALHLTAQSPNLAGEPASLDSEAHLNLTAHELRIEKAEARYHGQALRLLAPSQVAFADGIAVRRLRLGMEKAVIEIDGRLSPVPDLRASAHGIDADLINTFVPDLLIQGNIDADARLAGNSSERSGLVTLTAAKLRLARVGLQDLQAVDAHATVRLMGGSAQLDARVNAGSASELKLAGTAPLDTHGTLNLKVNGKLEAAFVNPLLASNGERVTGALTVNATVSGTAQSPDIGGTLDLTNGDVRDYVRGAHLSNVTAHLTGAQGTLKIESLTARAGPGELSVEGELGVMQPKLPVSLHLIAKKAQPVTSDVLTANLDADLKVEGTLSERLDLTGAINVNRALIGIPSALPAQVAVLNVRRPGAAPPPPPSRQLVIGLDLKLHAPREILVQGRGLNAELGGNLQIGGTTASPKVSGGFEMIRGTFSLASTTLNFTNGRVSFNGAGLAGKIDPTLDFTAQSTVSDTTATLHITGLADAPQFELSSSPPLPQDEILARLLFGESASQLSALQVAQIGAALASLSGVGGTGPNPLARVQKALGLDVLSVSSGSSGTQGAQSTGTIVEAGRYVSSRVFVAARESTTGFSQMEVDVDLSKHLKLQTRVGNGSATTQGITPENDPGSSIGMVYQFQY
jgi:translocation and assembly module TamB